MKREFDFWYPFDLRSSGKDLIQNHLTFCIYNHTSIWKGDRSKWPLSIRCNGHVLVNSEKMSKSLGNFKTLKQTMDEYSADAMRLALADAGDGLDDANFVEETANAAILRLTKELDWFEKMLEMSSSLRQGEYTYADRAFENEMSGCLERAEAHYENLMFREALRESWFAMTAARDTYRMMCDGDQGMHGGVTRIFMECVCKALAPITPHWSEHIWRTVLRKSGSVLKSGWPSLPPHDTVMQMGFTHMIEVATTVRQAKLKLDAPKKKQKVATERAVGVTVYVAKEFSGWHVLVLETIESMLKEGEQISQKDLPGTVLDAVKASPFGSSPSIKKELKNILSFARKIADEVNERGRTALALSLPYDEFTLLSANLDYMKRATGLDKVEVLEAPKAEGAPGSVAVPGVPDVQFETEPVVAK